MRCVVSSMKVSHKDVETSFDDLCEAMITLGTASARTFSRMSNYGERKCEICGKYHDTC